MASFIARWDASEWLALGAGSGMNEAVQAFAVYDGYLIAAGRFTAAGGLVAPFIAAWNGSNWLPLGSGVNAEVHTLQVYDGQLIVGGEFVRIRGIG